jgi:transcriptional regulator with XRE-family HTH domain
LPVALLGIAKRQISVKYDQKSRKDRKAKPLPVSIKTIGDWIQVKRIEKNLTSCHLALKMGIATALVCSWESGMTQPNRQQFEALASFLGFKAGMECHVCQPDTLLPTGLQNMWLKNDKILLAKKAVRQKYLCS